MDASQGIFAVASVAGAALGYCAGYLRRRDAPAAPAAPSPGEVRDVVARRREERRRAELEEEVLALRARAAAADDARARLAAAEAEAAAAQRAEQEARAEIARLREHAAGLAAEGARLREHAAGSAAEGARLREHAASLAAEGARLREEIAALRLTAQEAERRARAAEAGLRASDSGTQRTEATRFAPAPPALTAAAPTGAALDATLARVLAAGRARSIVLADGEGLLVSAAGDARHHEPLAALWGAIADVARRACEHLPFGAVRAMEIVDDRGRVLTSRAVDHGPSGLAVTALSDGGQRPQPELEASLAPISQTLKLERRRGA